METKRLVLGAWTARRVARRATRGWGRSMGERCRLGDAANTVLLMVDGAKLPVPKDARHAIRSPG